MTISTPMVDITTTRLMNGMGSMLVSSYVWVILSFAISSVLWFAMVVVIYPEQARNGPWRPCSQPFSVLLKPL